MPAFSDRVTEASREESAALRDVAAALRDLCRPDMELECAETAGPSTRPMQQMLFQMSPGQPPPRLMLAARDRGVRARRARDGFIVVG